MMNDRMIYQVVVLQIYSKKKKIVYKFNFRKVFCQKENVLFHDWILTTSYPRPPCDARNKDQSDSTIFWQTENNCHPSCYNIRLFQNLNTEDKRVSYCELINAAGQHKCQEYCRAKKRKRQRDVNNNSNNNSRGPARRRLNNNEPIFCRFGYPFKIPENLNDIFVTH